MNTLIIWGLIYLVGAAFVYWGRVKIAQDDDFWSTYAVGFFLAISWPVSIPVLIVVILLLGWGGAG